MAGKDPRTAVKAPAPRASQDTAQALNMRSTVNTSAQYSLNVGVVLPRDPLAMSNQCCDHTDQRKELGGDGDDGTSYEVPSFLITYYLSTPHPYRFLSTVPASSIASWSMPNGL